MPQSPFIHHVVMPVTQSTFAFFTHSCELSLIVAWIITAVRSESRGQRCSFQVSTRFARIHRHWEGDCSRICPWSVPWSSGLQEITILAGQNHSRLFRQFRLCKSLLLRAWCADYTLLATILGWTRTESAGVHDLQREISKMEAALSATGVEYEDERHSNVLWDEESRRLMLIDFERATRSDWAQAAPQDIIGPYASW